VEGVWSESGIRRRGNNAMQQVIVSKNDREEVWAATPTGNKPRHNYRYVCAELIRLYYRGQELVSHV
jgi:hypothetical protein